MVQIFGSFATGLHLPTSDVDCVIMCAEIGSSGVVPALKAIGQALHRKDWATEVEVRTPCPFAASAASSPWLALFTFQLPACHVRTFTANIYADNLSCHNALFCGVMGWVYGQVGYR